MSIPSMSHNFEPNGNWESTAAQTKNKINESKEAYKEATGKDPDKNLKLRITYSSCQKISSKSPREAKITTKATLNEANIAKIDAKVKGYEKEYHAPQSVTIEVMENKSLRSRISDQLSTFAGSIRNRFSSSKTENSSNADSNASKEVAAQDVKADGVISYLRENPQIGQLSNADLNAFRSCSAEKKAELSSLLKQNPQLVPAKPEEAARLLILGVIAPADYAIALHQQLKTAADEAKPQLKAQLDTCMKSLPSDQKNIVNAWKCDQSKLFRISHTIGSVSKLFGNKPAVQDNTLNFMDPAGMINRRHDLIADGKVSSELAVDMRIVARDFQMKKLKDEKIPAKLEEYKSSVDDHKKGNMEVELLKFGYQPHSLCNHEFSGSNPLFGDPNTNHILPNIVLGAKIYLQDDTEVPSYQQKLGINPENIEAGNNVHVYGFLETEDYLNLIKTNPLQASTVEAYLVEETDFKLEDAKQEYKTIQEFKTNREQHSPEDTFFFHCSHGKNRSALRTMLTLMDMHQLSAEEAMAVVNDGRTAAGVTATSLAILKIYEEDRGELDLDTSEGNKRFEGMWDKEIDMRNARALLECADRDDFRNPTERTMDALQNANDNPRFASAMLSVWMQSPIKEKGKELAKMSDLEQGQIDSIISDLAGDPQDYSEGTRAWLEKWPSQDAHT